MEQWRVQRMPSSTASSAAYKIFDADRDLVAIVMSPEVVIWRKGEEDASRRLLMETVAKVDGNFGLFVDLVANVQSRLRRTRLAQTVTEFTPSPLRLSTRTAIVMPTTSAIIDITAVFRELHVGQTFVHPTIAGATLTIERIGNKSNSKRKSSDFMNQLSVATILHHDPATAHRPERVNAKLFRNGRLQMTGICASTSARIVTDIVAAMLRSMAHQNAAMKLQRHGPVYVEAEDNLASGEEVKIVNVYAVEPAAARKIGYYEKGLMYVWDAEDRAFTKCLPHRRRTGTDDDGGNPLLIESVFRPQTLNRYLYSARTGARVAVECVVFAGHQPQTPETACREDALCDRCAFLAGLRYNVTRTIFTGFPDDGRKVRLSIRADAETGAPVLMHYKTVVATTRVVPLAREPKPDPDPEPEPVVHRPVRNPAIFRDADLQYAEPVIVLHNCDYKTNLLLNTPALARILHAHGFVLETNARRGLMVVFSMRLDADYGPVYAVGDDRSRLREASAVFQYATDCVAADRGKRLKWVNISYFYGEGGAVVINGPCTLDDIYAAAYLFNTFIRLHAGEVIEQIVYPSYGRAEK